MSYGDPPHDERRYPGLLVNLIDVAPTVTEVKRVPISRTSEVQGISLLA